MPFLLNIEINPLAINEVLNTSNLATNTPDASFLNEVVSSISPASINSPTEFPSIPELLGSHYIGYQIEKERFDLGTRSWKVFQTINVDGKNTLIYEDPLVAYNQVYRYRIFSVLKHTYSGSSIFPQAEDNLGAFNTQNQENNENIRSAYFRSNPSRWYYVATKETIPPPPPADLLIFPKTPKKEILLTWEIGANPQRDTKFYFVLRRKRIEDPWIIVAAELPISQNIFVDKNVDFGEKYIYAIQAEDAHRFRSKLSVQLQAELNEDFHCEKKEKEIKMISEAGCVPDMPRKLINKETLYPFEELIFHEKINLKLNLNFNEDQKEFILKVTSLDTMKTKNIKLLVKNKIENT